MKKVLIVEDDMDIVNLLNIHLNDLELKVDIANDGLTGFNMAIEGNYELIVLDIMLPKMDGIAVCQKLRALDDYTPILMLTAKSEEFDRVLGLESGADDYLTKPFGIREFIARIKAIIRRQKQNKLADELKEKKKLVFEGLEIEVEKRKVLLNGKKIDLTPIEFDLLYKLAQYPGKSYSRHQLLENIWGYEFNGYEHTVNSHINRLRSKIESDPNNPKYILTTWGIGYRFAEEV